MAITLFAKEPLSSSTIDDFMECFYSLRLRYLASDLLYVGLSPQQIAEAVSKAINIGKSSGIDVRQHFRPVFSSLKNEIIKDCKLSHLAYSLVLINADIKVSSVQKFQLAVIKKYLNTQ
jgi:hypothetical protein